jgi:hypothetical protein
MSEINFPYNFPLGRQRGIMGVYNLINMVQIKRKSSHSYELTI